MNGKILLKEAKAILHYYIIVHLYLSFIPKQIEYYSVFKYT